MYTKDIINNNISKAIVKCDEKILSSDIYGNSGIIQFPSELTVQITDENNKEFLNTIQ